MKKYPLRKIVGYTEELICKSSLDGSNISIVREKLECGHLANIKQDIYGETNAYRRRCKKCSSQKSEKGGEVRYRERVRFMFQAARRNRPRSR